MICRVYWSSYTGKYVTVEKGFFPYETWTLVANNLTPEDAVSLARSLNTAEVGAGSICCVYKMKNTYFAYGKAKIQPKEWTLISEHACLSEAKDTAKKLGKE